jgi:transcription-repair coupling factor (superfamily II helicase)
LQECRLITTPPRPAACRPAQASAGFAPELVRPAADPREAPRRAEFRRRARIEDMAPMAERLAKLVPILKPPPGPWQDARREIDEEMVRFAMATAIVLLATNIIEAGSTYRAPKRC